MNDFKDKGYVIIKEAITKEMATMAYNYLLLKRQVYDTMMKNKWLSVTAEEWGQYNDRQVPDTYAIYADTLMETLLMYVRPKMEKITELQLVETYSYARIYKKGDVLHRHKDRYSCEISTTMNLGGDDWPIYIENDPTKGGVTDKGYKSDMTDGKKVNLKPGDMLVYKGNLCEHWREAFDGEDCGQVFLHYNNAKTKGSQENQFDGRPHVGLPAWFKGRKI